MPADRDPRAEAWIFIGVGLLIAVSGRLGGLPDGDLARIRASRRALADRLVAEQTRPRKTRAPAAAPGALS